MKQIAVLIPARNPGLALVDQVRSLLVAEVDAIIVVDDGSDPEYEHVFEDLRAVRGVRYIRHAVNLGKGRALKTGINAFLNDFPNYVGLATADADGQHSVADILRTIAVFRQDPVRTVLGVRQFDGRVPIRSLIGNVITQLVFQVFSGTKVSDTQTGLRVFSIAMLPDLIGLEGERYEYEMTVLSHICQKETPREVAIEAIYVNENATSHFDPLFDSALIYFVLIRFYTSSILAAILDFVVFATTFALSGNIWASFLLGRSSSLLNFALNNRYVFQSHGSITATLFRYYLLVAAVSICSISSILWLTTTWHWNVIAAKITSETILSLASFSVQRTFVFLQRR